MQLSTPGSALELVNLSLHKRAWRDYYLVAGSDGGSGLGINIIAATKVSALDGLRQHQCNPGSRGNGCSDRVAGLFLGLALRWI
jgi:hypothetical protein